MYETFLYICCYSLFSFSLYTYTVTKFIREVHYLPLHFYRYNANVRYIFVYKFCQFLQTVYEKSISVITKLRLWFPVKKTSRLWKSNLCQMNSQIPLLEPSRNRDNTVCGYANLKNSIENLQRSEVLFPDGVLAHSDNTGTWWNFLTIKDRKSK